MAPRFVSYRETAEEISVSHISETNRSADTEYESILLNVRLSISSLKCAHVLGEPQSGTHSEWAQSLLKNKSTTNTVCSN